MKTLQDYIDNLNSLNFKEMYNNDFFWTWDKTDDELEAVFTVADALRFMRENNISTKVFESGLGISIFRDNSTRTRFSFAYVTFLVWKYRILMKRNLRSLMVKLFVKQQTWCLSWLM